MYVLLFYGSGEMFARHRLQFSEGYKAQMVSSEIRNIILYHIVADETEGSLKAVHVMEESAEEYFSQNFYEIFLSIDLNEKKLFACKRQPHNLLKISDTLKRIITEDEAETVVSEQIAPKTPPLFTYFVLSLNAVLFVLMVLSEADGIPSITSFSIDTLMMFGALNYVAVIEDGEWYRAMASVFLHSGIAHLAFNSLSLWIFGMRLERYMNRFAVVFIYLAAGLAGSVATLLTSSSQAVSIGASGAIFGLMGATLVLSKFIGTVGGLNFYSMLLFAAMGTGMGFLMENIGNAAHIGGLITGALISYLIMSFKKGKKNNA